MFGRRRRQPPAPPAHPALLDSELQAVASWVAGTPRVHASFDDAAFLEMTEGLMRVLAPHGNQRSDEMRAALVKVLAMVSSLPVLRGSDEDVFKLSTVLREDFYSEVMRLRRAFIQDAESGRI
ncbi:hypothetical protein [Lichenibacterium dinghuense]|uniref:hypothetical protein n=1 Tax=Lichenibacterium dinghuense TaxID=2895977 RepID=UPI001F3011CE|nr:hypothetical protein [Lichenibacterium sp. 6Y81]